MMTGGGGDVAWRFLYDLHRVFWSRCGDLVSGVMGLNAQGALGSTVIIETQ
jgi:hypothetical protein